MCSRSLKDKRQKAQSLWEDKYLKIQWIQNIAFVFNLHSSAKIQYGKVKDEM